VRKDGKKQRVKNLSTHEDGCGDRQGSHSFERFSTSHLLSSHPPSISYCPLSCLAGFLKKLHQVHRLSILSHLPPSQENRSVSKPTTTKIFSTRHINTYTFFGINLWSFQQIPSSNYFIKKLRKGTASRLMNIDTAMGGQKAKMMSNFRPSESHSEKSKEIQ
jgi:hypothetical protein